MAKKTFNVNDLVVMNTLRDAALFRVRRVEGMHLVVVDQAIEHMNPHEQYVDRSMCMAPSYAQLDQLV